MGLSVTLIGAPPLPCGQTRPIAHSSACPADELNDGHIRGRQRTRIHNKFLTAQVEISKHHSRAVNNQSSDRIRAEQELSCRKDPVVLNDSCNEHLSGG
jgi:hypothetical protein